MNITIGLLHSTIRKDEKLLIDAARNKGVNLELVDIRKQVFNFDTYQPNFDIALERSVSTVKGMYSLQFLQALKIPTVNTYTVAQICEDKFYTATTLQQAGVPTLRNAMVFDLQHAQQVVEKWGGFPVVVKPPLGSWGRLMAKVNDSETLEAIIDHKQVLGSPQQKTIYLQEYCPKPERDIRAFVIGGQTICAIYRTSEHWITNTANGGVATNCPVTPELQDLCHRASQAVGGGILAMDVFETNDGLTINEINHTMEFKNSEQPTGVSISEAIIDYCLQQLKN